MFKKILFSMCALLLFSTAKSQIKIGLTGGLTLAKTNITGDVSNISTDNISSFNAGAIVDFPINQRINIRSGLLYNSMGGKTIETVPNTSIITKGELNTNYINIPLLLNYTIISRVHLLAGPQLGFIASAKEKMSITGIATMENDAKDAYNSTALFGVGAVEVDLTNSFSVGVNYTSSLNNIAKEAVGYKVTTSGFGLNLVYHF